MFMLNSNEPIKVAHLQKLTNESMLNGKQLFQWKLEKSWSLDKARNVLIEKKLRWKNILLDFAKYQSFSEVQKNSKVANV